MTIHIRFRFIQKYINSITKEDMSQPPDPQAAKFRSIEVALTDKRPCGGRSMETTGAFGGVP